MVKRFFTKNRHVKQQGLDHQRLLSLINSMADGVLAIDTTMHIVLSNGAALNILNVNNSLRGRRLGSVLAPYDQNNQPIDIAKMVQQTKTQTTSRELLLRYNDDSKINLYLSIAPVQLGYGQQRSDGFVLLLRDITHEKSLEEERDEFISVVSHELRTPIAIAEGNISNAQFMLHQVSDLAQAKQALEQSHQQVLFLANMVNDLAMLSRAERGKLTMEFEPINVPELLQNLVSDYTPQAQAKNLTLHLSTDSVSTLLTSRLYLREVLQNFMTNAIKYTEKGHIKLSAATAQNGILFTISDTGVGISRADQEKLFDKFFRSEDYRTRHTNGTGLGLYVTMKLARLMHADIRVKSQLNKGSDFSIYVPNLQ